MSYSDYHEVYREAEDRQGNYPDAVDAVVAKVHADIAALIVSPEAVHRMLSAARDAVGAGARYEMTVVAAIAAGRELCRIIEGRGRHS